MSTIKFFFNLIFCFLFISCNVPEQIQYIVDFNISSPKTGWVYYDDSKVLLSLNINAKEVYWTSSIDGVLAFENNTFSFLSSGTHVLTAEVLGVRRSCKIKVFPSEINSGNEYISLVNYSPKEINLPSGIYYPYITSLDGILDSFYVNVLDKTGIKQKSLTQSKTDVFCLRDIRFSAPVAVNFVSQTARKLRVLYEYQIGQTKNFFVVNTISQFSEPHKIEAELYYYSDSLTFWIPPEVDVSEQAINACIQKVEQIVLPRLKYIWGTAADIDGDGRFAILVTPTINEERAAIGFFNPSDFYRLNTDIASDGYNPASNEMDIIYLAVPEDTPNSSYSIETTVATTAHELTHAITFTHKTWSRQMEGDTTAEREDLFLDEGLSHLSENLCGFGISGGNVKFLQKYYDDTASYSFCGQNRFGQDDSAGMRGAITLFLSWLVNEKGGIDFDISQPNQIIDKGGITFLKELVNSPDTGWDNIGKIAGLPTHLLFEKMIAEINNYRTNNNEYKYIADPFTNEPIDFFVNMNSDDDIKIIDFPKEYDNLLPNTIVPWTFALLAPIQNEKGNILTIDSQNQRGVVYFKIKAALLNSRENRGIGSGY